MFKVNGQTAEYEDVKNYLTSKGFKVKKGKRRYAGSDVYHFRREHCKIEVTIRSWGGNGKILCQTVRGGWKTYAWNRDITYLLSLADTIKPVEVKRTQPIKKENLPKPEVFRQEYFAISEMNSGRIYNLSQFQNVLVISVVAIEDDGSVSEKAVFDFKNDVWFLAYGYGSGTTRLITDGEGWYLIGSNAAGTKLRLKNNINNLVLNKVDQLMLQEAIRQYVNKKSNN